MDDDEYDCPLSLSRSEGPTAPFCEKARTAQRALFKTASPYVPISAFNGLSNRAVKWWRTRVAALVLRLVIEDKIIDPPRWMRRIADPQRDAA